MKRFKNKLCNYNFLSISSSLQSFSQSVFCMSSNCMCRLMDALLVSRKKVSLFLAFNLVSVFVFSQTTIQGNVKDEQSEPIIGAIVFETGTSNGSTTDIDGNFKLQVNTLPASITFKMIGYQTKILQVKNTNDLKIVLAEDVQGLDEVVVVGYGTQSRQKVASAISSIKSDQFKDVPSVSVDQVLQGRMTGVSITTPSGNVGQAPIVRVRGVNSITSGTSPLYVVDGMPIQSGNPAYSGEINVLADINPEDIQSVEVLKDAASAAVYGSRAANGVVLITTKKGKEGKPKLTYNTWVGISTYAKFFDVMNAQQYVDYKNLAVKNRYGTDEMSLTSGYTSSYGNKAFNLWYREDGSYVDTDWRDQVFRTGVQQSHSVSLSGGTQKVNYYVSANYTDQQGILRGDSYKRLATSANISGWATDWLQIGGILSVSNSKTESADRSRRGELYSYSGFTRLALANAPNIPVYDEDGNPRQESGTLGYGPNTIKYPLTNPAVVLQTESLMKTDNQRVLYNFFAEITPIQGLKVRTQYGKDYIRLEDRDFNSPFTIEGIEQNGIASNVEAKNQQSTWFTTASYTFNIEKHRLDGMLGGEKFDRSVVQWGARKTDLVDDSFHVFESAFKNIESIADKRTEASLHSYFGRINYDYDSKYILSANIRRDGYSALSKNNRWGTFGGVSAAWRISEESSFRSNVLSNTKLRASWGVVGNTNIDDYVSKSYYSTNYYGQDGSYNLGQIGSSDLKWESSKKVDIGLSTDLFRKINVELDYYHTTSSDLILNVPTAPSAGIPNGYITTNAGAMKNYGIELNIGARIINTKDFSWDASFNLTTNKNKVTKLSEGISELISTTTVETTNITLVGQSIGQLYLYPTGGIDAKTGRRIFYGEDGTKVLLEYEKSGKFFTEDGTPYDESKIKPVLAGNTIPTWYGGFTSNFRYKNFDLSIFLQYSGGNKIYNGTIATMSDVRWWNNSRDVWENHWSTENTNAKYALPVWGDNYSNGSAKPITDWVEKGDYLRMKNLSLGYRFNTQKWPKALGISELRVYAQAQNLFVLTKYSGLDPEVLSNTQDANLNGGTDHNTAPQARTFTFGLNLVF